MSTFVDVILRSAQKW